MHACIRAKRPALWALAHATTLLLLLLLLTCCHSNSTGEPRLPSNLAAAAAVQQLCVFMLIKLLGAMRMQGHRHHSHSS